MKRRDLDKVALIIPGCISPEANVPMLALKNASLRREQYLDSIKYYIESSNISNIIFCDNSASPIDNDLIELAQKYNKNFEWLSFKGNTLKTIEKGKGYGEGEIIEYILKNSTILRNCEVMVKITGRIIVKNLNWIMCLANKKNIYTYPMQKLHGFSFVSTKMYIMPIVSYKSYFIKSYENVDDLKNYYLEMTFADAINKNKLPYKLLPIFPNLLGVSGTSGEVYNSDLKNQIIQTLRMHVKNVWIGIRRNG